MGSSFYILNDTTEHYYVTHYNCQAALWESVRAVLAIGTPILDVGAGGTITLSQDDLGLQYTSVLHQVKNTLQRIKPGEKYTYNGTLSLVKTALVVSKDGRMKATRDVWTGLTDGSNIEYKLSKDFQYSQNIKRH